MIPYIVSIWGVTRRRDGVQGHQGESGMTVRFIEVAHDTDRNTMNLFDIDQENYQNIRGERYNLKDASR